MSNTPIFDVFQKGLIRGSERLAYDPAKSYAYVEHPTEGWRVYLRSCVFSYHLVPRIVTTTTITLATARTHKDCNRAKQYQSKK